MVQNDKRMIWNKNSCPQKEEDEQRVKALAQGLSDMEVSNDESDGR
jgi:hypothetical protein